MDPRVEHEGNEAEDELIKYEFLIFLGLGLAWAIWELVSTRRAIRQAREAEKPLDAAARRDQGPHGRGERVP